VNITLGLITIAIVEEGREQSYEKLELKAANPARADVPSLIWAVIG
jgi:hypothetical protein